LLSRPTTQTIASLINTTRSTHPPAQRQCLPKTPNESRRAYCSTPKPGEVHSQITVYFIRYPIADSDRIWLENPVPAALTATLITAQHIRPIAYLPLLFPPVFLFSSYLNVNGYKTDSAGITAAWSRGEGFDSGRDDGDVSGQFGWWWVGVCFWREEA